MTRHATNQDTRRRFIERAIAGAATLAASSFVPATAKADTEKFTLASVPRQATEAAKQLVAGGPVTLKILEPSGSLGDIKPVADQWTAATGIAVEYVEVPLGQINQKVLLESVSKSGSFDIALPASFGIPDLAASGVLRDLDDFAAKYEPADYQNDYLYRAPNTWEGKRYGYETDGDAYVMFYLKDWLDNPEEKKRFAAKYHYDLDVPKTWEEVDDTLAFFNRPDEGKYGGALFRTQYFIAWEFWSRFHAKGYYPFDENLKPQINNDAGVKALEQLIAASKNLYPGARNNGLFENFAAYGEGGSFANVGWGGTQKYLNSNKSKVKGKLAFGPMPGGIVKGKLLQIPYFNWGWNYVVSSYSKHPEIAYLFTLYACSPQLSTVAVRDIDGYFDPFRLVHYSDPKIIENYTEPFLKVHKFAMANSIPDLYLRGQGEYFDALRVNVQAADVGEKSPKAALDDVARKWDDTTRRLGNAGQEVAWKSLKAKYPAAVRTRLT